VSPNPYLSGGSSRSLLPIDRSGVVGGGTGTGTGTRRVEVEVEVPSCRLGVAPSSAAGYG
jgi:hypothetical protein